MKLDGCIVWNTHNAVLGEEALLIYIVPVCYERQLITLQFAAKSFYIVKLCSRIFVL